MNTRTAWKAGFATDAGITREANEDRVHVDPERGVFLIVDGLGGHAAGERAAEIAVATIVRELDAGEGPVDRRIRRAITEANNAIFAEASAHPENAGMACVLTLAVIEDETLTFGHVGDSRLYLIWNGSVRKVTSDHSPVGELEDQGELSELEAMLHPRRNEVFRGCCIPGATKSFGTSGRGREPKKPSSSRSGRCGFTTRWHWCCAATD